MFYTTERYHSTYSKGWNLLAGNDISCHREIIQILFTTERYHLQRGSIHTWNDTSRQCDSVRPFKLYLPSRDIIPLTHRGKADEHGMISLAPTSLSRFYLPQRHIFIFIRSDEIYPYTPISIYLLLQDSPKYRYLVITLNRWGIHIFRSFEISPIHQYKWYHVFSYTYWDELT